MLFAGAIAEEQISASLGLLASLAAIEAGDTLIATGGLRIVGVLAATEDGDTIVATAVPPNTGAVAVTEDADTLAATGVPRSPILAVLDVTEDGDTLSAGNASTGSAAGTSTAAAIATAIVGAVGASAGAGGATASAAAVVAAAGASAGVGAATAGAGSSAVLREYADSWDGTFGGAKFTLSNGELTATAVSLNAVDTIIGTVSHTTGKFYFEISGFNGTGDDLEWGLTVSGQSNGSQLWVGDGTNRGAAFRNSRNWRINATETASGMTTGPASSDTLGFAVDLTAGRAYIRKSNVSSTTWYGNNTSSADPVAGTGGFDISSVTGQALFIAFTSNQNGTSQPTIMNAGASAFIAAAPTGYSVWGIAMYLLREDSSHILRE